MSTFFSGALKNLAPYTPGEQPQDQQYVKLNTNESPYPPSAGVITALNAKEASDLRLYSDPECKELKKALADYYKVEPENIYVGNGSDEALNFAFLSYATDGRGVAFADITYGFYPVFADLYHIPVQIVPLKSDFSIAPEDYYGLNKTIVIANPNAPTGMALSRDAIEGIVKANPDSVVVVDEAYVDFGAASAAALLGRYENLLVVMTYSKSRSMAGARLGFALGSRELIADLERLKYATNPYNVNRLTLRLGEAAVDSDPYFRANARRIMATRDKTARALREMGFRLPDSQANFLFVTHPRIDGARLYQKCRERGILIRHFSDPAIAQYNRVTIGAEEEMETFLTVVRDILREEGL